MSLGYYMAASFFLDTVKTGIQHQNAERKAAVSREDANRQYAVNNQIDYDSRVNLNRQQQLQFKKFGLDSFALAQLGRREAAKSAATRWWQTVGKESGSFQAGQNNIRRHLAVAQARKNLNQRVIEEDFIQRHKNITTRTTSANNAARAGIIASPDSTAALLNVASSGLQIATDYESRTGEV